MASATNPNVTYPNHIPTCVMKTTAEEPRILRPAPPSAAGSRRYAGTQVLRPHHPNSVQAFITVNATLGRARSPRKRSRNDARSADGRARRHTSGSSTWRWTHSAKNAGSTPTKNTARQPHSGSNNPVTIAARPNPIAHELCMNANARPRVAAGHDSDTSAAPLAHSPPIPNPRHTRKAASCHRLRDKPQSAVKIEYKSTLAIKARLRPYRSAKTP